MIPTFRKHIDLSINLPSDEILFLGHPHEAAGKLLQGTLDLNLTEPIKIKSITLSFIGKIKVSWSEDNGHNQYINFQQKTIISHDWAFYSSSQKVTVLKAGKHSWPFELLLPGDLPQTILSDIGNISYCLTATIEKPSFIHHTTIIKKRKINIVRCILRFDQSLIIHNTWAEKLAYDINVPSRTYAFNDTIPISIHLLPIAPHIQVLSITVSLKEYIEYKANNQSKSTSRILCMAKLDHHRTPWHTRIHLPVPSQSPTVFANADSELIRIRHRLKFCISLINADGHVSEIRCASKLVIIESFALSDEFSTLPAYHETCWRSIVQEETTPSSSSDEEENQPLMWHGMDLGKVPSYHSVANLNQDAFVSPILLVQLPPPSYEACLQYTL